MPYPSDRASPSGVALAGARPALIQLGMTGSVALVRGEITAEAIDAAKSALLYGATLMLAGVVVSQLIRPPASADKPSTSAAERCIG